MEEYWINSDQDWSEFMSYTRDEKLTLQYSGFDNEGFHIVKAGNVIVHVPKTCYDPKPAKYDSLIFGKNHTENVVNITIDNEQAFITVMDMNGKIVYSQQNMSNDIGHVVIDLSGMASGTYLLKYITTNGISKTEKIIKQ